MIYDLRFAVGAQANSKQTFRRGRSSGSPSIIDADKFSAQTPRMAKKAAVKNGRADLPVGQDARQRVPTIKPQKPSALLDTRVIYCGDNLEQLAKLPDACVDLIYIDPPFSTPTATTRSSGARPGRSAPLKTATRTPRPTLTTCARAACNSPASSNRPAAFITTATGTPATTSRSCPTD